MMLIRWVVTYFSKLVDGDVSSVAVTVFVDTFGDAGGAGGGGEEHVSGRA